MYRLSLISHHLCHVSVTIRESLEGRKSSSHRPANIGGRHNAQPGEEEPRSFFDISSSGDLTGSAALFLATEVEILLVLGRRGEPILPPGDLIGGSHQPANLGRTDEFDHLVPINNNSPFNSPR